MGKQDGQDSTKTGVSHKEAEYQFINEQIRPKKHQKIKDGFGKMVNTVLLAVVFGVVAGITFGMLQDLMGKNGNANKQMNANTSGMEISEKKNNESEKIDQDRKQEKKIRRTTNIFYAYGDAMKEMSAIGEKVNNSIVTIIERKDDNNFFQNSMKGKSSVYGLLIKKDDENFYFLTPVGQKKNEKLEVIFQDNEQAAAEMVSYEKNIGMAVIKVRIDDISNEMQEKIQVASLGKYGSFELGEPIIAVGNPNGVMYSVLSGYITNNVIKADVPDGKFSLYGTSIPYAKEENGVIIDLQGNVIGVISNAFPELDKKTNCSFIGMYDVYESIERMIHSEKIAYLGLQGADLTDYPFGVAGIRDGVSVKKIYADSPAYHAGLRVADIITQIDGMEVSDMHSLRHELLKKIPGQQISISVVRMNGLNGKTELHHASLR